MSEAKTALGLVTDLLERLRRSDVRELEVREGKVRVRVSKDGSAVSVAQTSYVPQTANAPVPVPAAGPSEKRAADAARKAVTAPLTGIFYRSPSPQAPPFVQVGSAVREGDVVGLIEAMKLFNEVRSTVGGRVARINAESGQLVRAHQPILELE